ncbi:putative baseplate assembly protein [Haladaptatus sp. NG-SE-30]
MGIQSNIMSLNIPELDDREYAEIIEEAQKRIPVYSKSWTDHNASDPGITILELLSWIAETYSYQLDQITDAHQLKYLELMGEKPRPPEPATVKLSMTPPDGSGSVRLEESTKLVATDMTDVIQGFETTEDVVLTEAQLERVLTDGRHGRFDNSDTNKTAGMYFLAFGESAAQGNELYLGFEGDPFTAADTLSLTVTLHEEDLPEPATHGEFTDSCNEESEFEPSVELVWEYCDDHDNWHLDEAWVPLIVESDETYRFYRSGDVTFRRPENDTWQESGGALFGENRAYRWIRCVVKEDGYEVPPPVDSIAVNIVRADQRWTVEYEADDEDKLGEPLRNPDGKSESTGQPGQIFAFERSPILDEGLTIRVGGERWDRVNHFDISTPESKHYVLNHTQGEIRFGDGVRGKIPPTGATISATSYVVGGGSEGNVSQEATWEFEDATSQLVDGLLNRSISGTLSEVSVEPVEPAVGGKDAETLDEAFDRLSDDQHVPYRAVSPEDYEYIALHTPGLRFGRTTARIVKRDVPEPCEPHYEVQVIVVPFSTVDEPAPSSKFLETVAEHIERHRLLTDRVSVHGPSYVTISVNAEVRLDPNYSIDDRIRAIEQGLDTFLHPLEGFEGDGWPFGRSLFRSELYEEIENVPGVECVTELRVEAQNERGFDSEGNVIIDETALLSPDDHNIVAQYDTRSTSRPGECK